MLETLSGSTEESNLIINEDSPGKGHFLINTKAIHVNHTAEYSKIEFQHVHLAHEIIFVEDGEVEYQINGSTYTLAKNDILLIGSMDIHYMTVKKIPYIRYGLSIMPEYISDRKNMDIFESYLRTWPVHDLDRLKHVSDSKFSFYLHLLHTLNHELQKKEPLYKENMDACLTLILTSLFRRMDLLISPGKHNNLSNAMGGIKQYIIENYYKDITLESLGQMFYLHPCTISKSFSQCYGKTFKQYLTGIRIEMSVQYLEQTDYSITKVCEKCGFPTINTFLRCFHAYMNCSPLQYRKRHLEKKQLTDYTS